MAVYLDGLPSPKSQRLMRLALNQFAAIASDGAVTDAAALDWREIDYRHTSKARATFMRTYAPEGARVRLSGVKMVLRTAWRLGLIDGDTYHRAVDLDPIRGGSLARGRALAADETEAVFASCQADTTLSGLRDAAMFALFRTGIRVDELVQVNLPGDYIPSRNGAPAMITVRRGKGRKARTAYLAPLYDAVIQAWLAVRGTAPGALICSVLRGKVRIKTLTTAAVYNRCILRAASAGVARFTPHDQRRTTATDLHEDGVPVTDIRDVLGHANVQTTERYIRNDRERAKQAAAMRLANPKNRRSDVD
ncbi:MAG: tyrosine-type recombinase/integrase [Deltaproteobacteria bacterium]|nr:tyrosine-type recombinase/integrase [Deltaproteobacteria bacterium]